MPSTLTSLRDRVEAFLMDSSNLSWDTGVLDESIRQALAFIIQAREPAQAYTISGLDGAVATTLPEDDTAYLVMGSAGFAARARAANRAQLANLDQSMPAALLSWSNAQIDAFMTALGLPTTAAAAGDGLAIATLQASNAVTLAQMQIDAAVAAVTAANARADAKAAEEAARLAGLQSSNSSPHDAWPWTEPKTW